jgi:YbgC/YbaW family acyl-CoA thioester hydrolase
MASPRTSEYRLHRRVQFHEVDSAGIVHFSWFFRYMEEAEHALWREAGVSIAPAGAAVAFPRVSTSFDFHHPLRFEDEFDIHIRITAMSEKTIRYACAVTCGGTRIATGTMVAVCVGVTPGAPMKAISIPSTIVQRLTAAPDSEVS